MKKSRSNIHHDIEINTTELYPELLEYFITHTEYKETTEKYKNCQYCKNSEIYENKLYCDILKTTVFNNVDENHTCKYNVLNHINNKKHEINFREVNLNNCTICKYYHEDYDFYMNQRCLLHGSSVEGTFPVNKNTICDKFERSKLR